MKVGEKRETELLTRLPRTAVQAVTTPLNGLEEELARWNREEGRRERIDTVRWAPKSQPPPPWSCWLWRSTMCMD